MQRKCSGCGVEKPREDFSKNLKSGRVALRCIECGPPKGDTNKWLHKSIHNLLMKKMHQAKYNAAKRGNEFGLNLEILLEIYEKQSGLCAVSKVKLSHSLTNPWANVSIDRIDCNKGYLPDNIRLVCSAVNVMRNRMSDEELLWWAKQISKGMRGGD